MAWQGAAAGKEVAIGARSQGEVKEKRKETGSAVGSSKWGWGIPKGQLEGRDVMYGARLKEERKESKGG